jgi:Protein of unknown function (DUF3159)
VSEERPVDARRALSLAESLGGRRGVAESGLPSIVFVAAYTASGQDLRVSVWLALVAGAVLAVVRLVRRETVQHAVAGFVGVAIAAWIASRTGRAENFFLPGLLINAGYAAAYAVSILARWPLLGVIVGPLSGHGMAWRDDPVALRGYSRASWIWVAMFVLRLIVQLPLYLTGAVVALGVARLAMGWPLFVVAIYLSWLVLRRVPGISVPSMARDG